MPARGHHHNGVTTALGGGRDIPGAIDIEDGPAGVRRDVQACPIRIVRMFDDAQA